MGSLVSLECQGWGWYGKWTLIVAGVPSLALLAIGVRWLQLRFGGCRASRLHVEPEVEVSVGSDRLLAARKQCFGLLLFAAMLLYPQVSASRKVMLLSFACARMRSATTLTIMIATYRALQCIVRGR